MTSTSFPRALPDDLHHVRLSADDLPAVLELDTWTFPGTVPVEELAGWPFPLTWERTWGVQGTGGGPLLAMHGSYPFGAFPVPGGTLAVSGLTWVGVHPQARRRGILSAMIDRHLTDCVERGESVSALFAAEAAIYGRFGYGSAADDVKVTVPRKADLHDVPGSAEHTVRIELADQARHGTIVEQLHREAGAQAGGGLGRPGWPTRETPELQAAFWSDPPAWRNGGESLRILLVERDGRPRGYALFRRKSNWEDAGPRGSVHVREVAALDAAAAHALWSRLLDLDHMATVHAGLLAPDDALLGLLVDSRAAQRRLTDNVWVRLVDVAGALGGRRYAGDVDVTIAVHDGRLEANTGTWRVRARAFEGDVQVERTQEPAALAMDVRELGAAYLGGRTLTALAATGLVEVRDPAALAAASTAFSWPVAPVSSWVF
ncbi:GNAT family N-acetyltransferase [Cellulomonas soli]|uniref:GNAT family N-acetyltransferase n=1 Tax=Cellulomonas soli TaxID=931535 RepID=UPI003F859A5E